MSEPSPQKPYLLRALFEWCVDNGYTPYISVAVDERTRVPVEYVRNGEIVLNIGPLAASKLKMGNEFIEFAARFGGVAKELFVPVEAVTAIYARENGHGMSFELAQGAKPGWEVAGHPTAKDRPADEPRAPDIAVAPLLREVPVTDDDAPRPPSPAGGGARPSLRRIK